MRRIVKAALWLALAALLLLAAFAVVQYHRAPSLEPFRPLTLPAAGKAAPGAVQVRFGGVATLVGKGGGYLRRAQTGYVRSYALVVAGGTAALLVWVAIRSLG